jgi:hypothetical protein
MRRIEITLFLILPSGCRSSPSIDSVTAETKAQLQRRLEQDYTDRHATVSRVGLVQTTAPKYEAARQSLPTVTPLMLRWR